MPDPESIGWWNLAFIPAIAGMVLAVATGVFALALLVNTAWSAVMGDD